MWNFAREISILTSHVELDKGHVADLKICEQVFKDDYSWPEIESVIDKFVKYTNGFYNDIVNKIIEKKILISHYGQ